jgi:hypothetical protein
MEDDYTSLRLLKRTLKRLSKYGEYGDSMDSILNKLMDKVDGKI